MLLGVKFIAIFISYQFSSDYKIITKSTLVFKDSKYMINTLISGTHDQYETGTSTLQLTKKLNDPVWPANFTWF